MIGLLAPTFGDSWSASSTRRPVFALVGFLITVVVDRRRASPSPSGCKHQIPPPPPAAPGGDVLVPLEPHDPAPPLAASLAAACVLIVLALPVLSIRLGFGDNGNLPEKQTAARPTTCSPRASAGLQRPAAPGRRRCRPAPTRRHLEPVTARRRQDPGRRRLVQPADRCGSDDLALCSVYPDVRPQDKATERAGPHACATTSCRADRART